MKDASNTAMMAPKVDTKTLHVPSGEPAWGARPSAPSALKERRGNRSQIEIARAAGISQGFLSELESGRKRLTSGVAKKLAPALGMSANQLVLAEYLANLSRIAQKGNIDVQPLLAEADRLTEILPGGEIGDAIIDAIVTIVREQQKMPN